MNDDSARVLLGKIINELSAGNESALEKRIIEANGGEKAMGLDRRKLSDLIKGQCESISFSALDALNHYMIREHGQTLRSIFCNPTLVEALASRGKIAFLFGAKHRGDRTEISIWDFTSMEKILRDIYRTVSTARVDVFNVPLPVPSVPGSKAAPGNHAIDDWEPLSRDPHGPSLICLGSQRTSEATEKLLARMFQVVPFQPASRNGSTLPFAFIWSAGAYPSAFSVTPSEIGIPGWRIEPKNWQTWAIYVPRPPDGAGHARTLYRVEQHGTKWKSYGVIVAQRRPNGQAWVILAGLSGPETFGGAKAMDSIVKALPPWNGDKPAPVLWALYEATVEMRHVESGDKRKLVGQKLLFQDYWPVSSTPSLLNQASTSSISSKM